MNNRAGQILICVGLAFLTMLSVTSCKKQRLKVQRVEQLESHTGNRINRVQFIDNNIGITCGGERFHAAEILRSEDGGNTWALSSHPEAGKGLYGISVTPSGGLIASGFDGKILTSDDDGANWKFHQIHIWKFYNAVACPSNDSRIFVTTNAWNFGTVIRTDGSLNVIDTTYFKFGMNDIAMPDANTGYISCYGTVLKTTNGGSTWEYLDIKNDNFIGIHALDVNNVWVCGNRGSIFKTTNGGSSWERLRNGNSLARKRYDLLNIFFKDTNTGWACGEDGLLIGTTDGGNNWKEYEKFTSDALRDIAAAPDGNLIVVGDNGGLYKLYL